MKNSLQLSKFIKKNKFINECLIFSNIVLHTDFNVLIFTEFFDTNEKLKIIKLFNNNEILSYTPSVKYMKFLLKNKKQFKNIFCTNFTFLYFKNKNKIIEQKKLNLILKQNFIKIIGCFIEKKFYKWHQLKFININHENILFLLFSNLKNNLFKYKNLTKSY